MGCPLCGGNVLYHGLNNIECDGRARANYAGRDLPACANYRTNQAGQDTVPMAAAPVGLDWMNLNIGWVVVWQPKLLHYEIVSLDRQHVTLRSTAKNSKIFCLAISTLSPEEWCLA